jgi:hypothetical protein
MTAGPKNKLACLWACCHKKLRLAALRFWN